MGRARAPLSLSLLPALLGTLTGAGCGTAPPPPAPAEVPGVLRPPVAQKRPTRVEQHGQVRVDDYAWLQAKDAPEVLEHLRAENAYAEQELAPTRELSAAVYDETLARIQQTDETPPVRRGAYVYYSRTIEGKQHRVYCRRPADDDTASEQVLLDLNLLAEQYQFVGLGAFTVSDDGALLAYGLDSTGFRDFTLHVKDLRTGELRDERIEHVKGAAWAADSQTLFYTVDDDAKRPYRLYRHTLGAGAATLVYEEADERFRLHVARSRSKAFMMVISASHTSTEVRVIPAHAPGEAPRLLAARRADVEYYVEHRGQHFLILTNDAGRNFRVVTAAVESPAPAQWRELIPHSNRIMLEDLDVFQTHLVLHERDGGLPHLRVVDFAPDEESTTPAVERGRRIPLPEPVYALYGSQNPEFDATRYRFRYESLTTPDTWYEYDVRRDARHLVKRTRVFGGYDASRYVSARIFAKAEDGTCIPISLVRRADLPDGPGPLWLLGYGAYGFPYPTTFSHSRVSLLDRGMTVAIAHVRGGGELGKAWHDDGRMAHKQNSFSDFISAARHLQASGYTTPAQTAISGASAGGLLVGTALNQAPELFGVAILDVPFVDVLNTMSNSDLPLTVGEYEEWGNPNVPADFQRITAYCPYTNIAARAYPPILVRTAYNDSQVMYWEPAKYVAKLRAHKADDHPLLFWTNMAGGHGGSSGRYDRLRETAQDYAFVLHQLASRH